MSVQEFIQYLKNISLETLSNEELDILKEELIRFIVDIQIQKDINNKVQQKHFSTEDIQLEIMQKTENFNNKTTISDSEKNIILSENNTPTPEKDQQTLTSSYQAIIEEKISEAVISIYSSNETSTTPNTPINSEVQQPSSTTSGANKIIFPINDKFRIQKKLFQNNNTTFEKFIFELNNQTNLDTAVQLIHNYAQQLNWDENSAEYKLLVQYNRKRFQ